MEGPLWVVEKDDGTSDINHDGLVRLLLNLDMGATVHFPCDPVIVGMDGPRKRCAKARLAG